MFIRYAESYLDTFAIEIKSKLFALKDGFMISTNDMNDFMMRAILGDANSSVFLLSMATNII